MNAPTLAAPRIVTPAFAYTPISPVSPAATLAAPAALSILPTPPLAPAVFAPTPVAVLQQAALPTPSAELPALGRRVFDGALARLDDSEAVSGTLSPVLPLPARAPLAVRALTMIPAVPALAEASSNWGPYPLLAFVIVLAATALVILRRPIARPQLTFEPLRPAETGLIAVREQTTALTEELLAASASERKPEKVARALSTRWQRALLEGGVRMLTADGTVRAVPISAAVFEAIDLPQILGLLAARQSNPDRYFNALGDLFRGLPLETTRARTEEEALTSLAWWKTHFRQFPG